MSAPAHPVRRDEPEPSGASDAHAATTTAPAGELLAARTAVPHEGSRDFDFLFGRWHVHNERLAERLAGSTRWQRFDARVACRPLLGGAGNLDEYDSDEFGDGAFHGLALRLFDRVTHSWSIYWASNRGRGLEPPVVGAFANGVGRFEGEDVHAGRPVRVRFVWSRIDADRARWEQAFSADGGASWETNWIMHFTRVAGGAR